MIKKDIGSSKIYASHFEAWKNLPDEQFGELLKVVLDYTLNGEEIDIKNPTVKMLWETVKYTYDRIRIGHLTGYRSTHPPTVRGTHPPDKDKDKDKDKLYIPENSPNLQDLKNYATEKQYNTLETEKFIKYNAGRGWAGVHNPKEMLDYWIMKLPPEVKKTEVTKAWD